jgi:hypothetical protein
MLSSSPFVLHALPISSSLTWLFKVYLAKSTNCEAPFYAIFSTLLSLHSPLVQIFSSALLSNALSLCSALNVTFRQIQRQYYSRVYSNFYVFRQQARRYKVLDWMVASITRTQYPLNSLLNQFSFVIIVSKYSNSDIFWNDLLAIFMSWFGPALCWRDSFGLMQAFFFVFISFRYDVLHTDAMFWSVVASVPLLILFHFRLYSYLSEQNLKMVPFYSHWIWEEFFCYYKATLSVGLVTFRALPSQLN